MSEEFRERIQSEKGPELDQQKKPKYTVEVVSGINEDIVKAICEIEEASFPEQIRSSPEDIKEVLENRDGIHLLVKDKEGKILGNILSLRQSQEYDNLLDHDADFTNDGDALYIESIAVKPKNRDLGVFNSLLKSLNKEAKKRNYKKITMHARVSTGLSKVLQSRYGAKFLRRIENWHDFGEPFDYLEIEISEDDIEK